MLQLYQMVKVLHGGGYFDAGLLQVVELGQGAESLQCAAEDGW